MRAIRKTDQGGSVRVTTIVAIGIILALVIAGSISYVTQRGEQAQTEQVATSQDNTSQKELNTEVVPTKTSESSNKVIVESALSASNLPNTGPQSSLADLIAVFFLTVAVFGYMSSKRYVPRYL